MKSLRPPVDASAMAVVAAAAGYSRGAVLVAALAVPFCYAALGLYRPRLTLSVLDELPRVVAGVAVAVAAGQAYAGPPRPDLPLAVALRATLAGAAVVALARAVGYPAARRARRRRPGTATLILGGAQLGVELGRTLLTHPEYGLRPIGYLDGGLPERRRQLPLPLLGTPRELARVIARFHIRTVLVAFGMVRPSELAGVLRTCGRMGCEILVVPRLYELGQPTRDIDHIRSIPLARVSPAGFRRRTWRLKRVVDVAVAGVALALAAPVLGACALAVRLEGGPGVLFRQERVGQDGRRFQMLKLRSLRPTSESEAQTRWTVAGDHRMGPVGRLLRVTSLDELPQLVNVLRGEMSLVGPRPERPFFVERFGRRHRRYHDRHRVPAGLTGWAAVNGLRGDTSIDDRIRFDNHYIENWSLWFDIKILVWTLGAILTRTRA